jgi:hypothetical protein
MPFHYDIKVPDLAPDKPMIKYLFVKWLLPQKSNIDAGTAVAIVGSGDALYVLRRAGPGFFSRWYVKEGHEVSPGQTIGRITTDGELIPYGRAYVTFDLEASDGPVPRMRGDTESIS